MCTEWPYVRVALRRTCGEIFADEIFADEIFADKIFAGEIFADEIFADEIFADEIFADEIFADEIFADEISAQTRPIQPGSAQHEKKLARKNFRAEGPKIFSSPLRI